MRSLAAGVIAFGCAVAALPLAAAAREPIAHAIAIKDGQVPRAQRVLKASHESLVRIDWTADRPMTVHLEGYDISVVVRPDQPATMQFKAFATGRFPVHAHEGDRAGAKHAHGRGALLRLEVHPR